MLTPACTLAGKGKYKAVYVSSNALIFCAGWTAIFLAHSKRIQDGVLVMSEFDTFVESLINGKFRHLSPHSKDPSEPSLELLASLWLDEQKRLKQDTKFVRAKIIVWASGPTCFALVTIALFALEKSFIPALLYVAPFIVASFATLVLWSSHGEKLLTAQTHGSEYKKKITSFLDELNKLAGLLRFSSYSILDQLKRDFIAEHGLAIGAGMQSQIRMFKDPHDPRARLARYQLDALHATLEKFKLDPKGGRAAYGRYVSHTERPAQTTNCSTPHGTCL